MLYKKGKLIKLSNPPHTLAEMLISEGGSRESIKKQPGLSATLTRCIGFQNTEPSMNIVKCKPPFSVVIASDGIDYIPENELEHIFREIHLTECLPGKIIFSALEHGSSDNITVVATKVKAQTKYGARHKRVKRQKRGGLKYV